LNIKDELFLVTGALERASIDHALCGGMAVIIHGYPRLTRDIDLLLREEDLERAREALEDLGYTLPSGILPFDLGKPTERKVFRVTKVEGKDHMTLDLVLVSPFLEDVWRGRERHLVEGRTLRVVSREGLAKMKRAAGRPQDLADLSQLGLGEGQTVHEP
jgi:hypothetical protein